MFRRSGGMAELTTSRWTSHDPRGAHRHVAEEHRQAEVVFASEGDHLSSYVEPPMEGITTIIRSASDIDFERETMAKYIMILPKICRL